MIEPCNKSYWILKSEPSTWSWEQQKAKGNQGEKWDGVRNYQARNYMKSMRIGDIGFFYHSGKETSLVGVIEIIKTYYPDPSDETGKFGMVDVRYFKDLSYPVTLANIKQHRDLQHIKLVTQSRLSVIPLTEKEFRILCSMGGIEEGA